MLCSKKSFDAIDRSKMKPEYIFLVIVVVIAGAFFFVRRVVPRMITSEEAAKKSFACPNCGHVFCVSWKKLFFKQYRLSLKNQVNLKCPNCKKKDMCARPFNDN